MKYKEITITSFEQEQTHIIIENEDGSFKSFPKNELNSEYLNFLEHIKEYELIEC